MKQYKIDIEPHFSGEGFTYNLLTINKGKATLLTECCEGIPSRYSAVNQREYEIRPEEALRLIENANNTNQK